MKKWLPVIILFLLLVSGFYFWSLGSIPDKEPSRVLMTEMAGTVEAKPSGSAAWSSVTVGQELAEGTTLRTGVDGGATIRFFDRSESRLGSDSMLVIDRASKTASAEATIKLKLESGRLWSRVLRLLDLDGGFSAETNDVVATVRGTAFDLEKRSSTGTTLWVAQSVVEAVSAQGAASPDATTSNMVADRTMKRFSVGGSSNRERISAEAMAGDWTKKNLAKDQAFLQNFVGKGSAPSSLADGLVRLSERLHVRLTSENDKRDLDARYIERRLVRLRALSDQGRIGEASSQFLALEEDVNSRLAGKDAEAWRPTLKAIVYRAWLAFDDVKPDQEAYRLKQRMEDLLLSTASASDERVFFRLMGLDARLDEAFAAVDAGDDAFVSQSIDLVGQGLDNAAREIKQASDTIGAAHIAKLWTKHAAEWARLDALRLRLSERKSASGSTGPESATSTPALPFVATSTVPTTTKPIVKPTAPPPTAIGLPYSCAKLDVFAQPNPVDVGSLATIFVRAVKTDGSMADVTASASFKAIGSLGTLNRNIFTARTAGAMQIQGSVTCNGQPMSGQLSIQINAGPVVPKTLTITPSPQTIGFFERSALSAMLTYSNGTTKDVSASMRYQSSNAAVGTISGNVFLAGQTVGASAVSGSYTESGVTVSDAPTITVIDRSAKP